MPDDYDELHIKFGEIIGTEFDIEDVDAKVDVLLVNGTTLSFVGLDAFTLTEQLAQYGLVQMQDATGKVAVVFTRGVAAVIGTGGGDDE